MNEIQKVNTGLSVIDSSIGMTPAVKEIYEALNTELVSNSLPPSIFNAIKVGVAKSYADTGFNIPGTDEEKRQSQEYLIMEVMKYIRKMYQGLRLGEIPIAFAAGIRKEYGDYMGLSVLSFCNFVDGYIKDQARKNALLEKGKLMIEESRIPDYNEVFDTAKGNALKALSDLKACNELGLYSGVVHDFLETIGLIDLEDDEIKELKAEARQLILLEYANKVEPDKFKRINNQIIIEALIGKDNQDKVKHLINIKAKMLALKAYLQSIIFDEVDFDELIESKRDILDNEIKTT